MGRKRVILFSPFFHPEPISTGRYNTFLAEALRDRGASVEVVCSHPLYPSWKPSYTSERLDGITPCRGGGWLRYPKTPALRRALLEVWFAAHALKCFVRLGRRADILVPIFPPELFFLGVGAVAPRGVKSVGIVHDLQGVLARHVRGGGGLAVDRVVQALEGRALRRCDRLILLSHGMRESAAAKYAVDRSRCRVCYPFVTPAAADEDRADLETHFGGSRHHIVYSGALGEKQNPAGLLALFARIVEALPEVSCHVFSSGQTFEAIRQAGDPSGTGRIRFHDLVPEQALPELYRRSTVQVIPQMAGTEDGAFPSKLPNLLAAGVPVLAICAGRSEVAKVLADSGGGVSVDSWEIPRLVDAVAALLGAVDAETRSERRARLAGYVRRHFDVGGVVDEILDPHL